MLIIYISNLILSKITTGDHYILLIVSMLMSIGIIMIHRINPELGFKQIVWCSWDPPPICKLLYR